MKSEVVLSRDADGALIWRPLVGVLVRERKDESGRTQREIVVRFSMCKPELAEKLARVAAAVVAAEGPLWAARAGGGEP